MGVRPRDPALVNPFRPRRGWFAAAISAQAPEQRRDLRAPRAARSARGQGQLPFGLVYTRDRRPALTNPLQPASKAPSPVHRVRHSLARPVRHVTFRGWTSAPRVVRRVLVEEPLLGLHAGGRVLPDGDRGLAVAGCSIGTAAAGIATDSLRRARVAPDRAIRAPPAAHLTIDHVARWSGYCPGSRGRLAGRARSGDRDVREPPVLASESWTWRDEDILSPPGASRALAHAVERGDMNEGAACWCQLARRL